MSKRTDIQKIMIIGSGPIVIGQACEFDYSGTQACKALKAEGYEIILVNSNPATIMTDPDLAHRVYIEPLQISYIRKIIEEERPDAIIPTLGGQTALNLAMELHDQGILEEFGVELLGSKRDVIKTAEDREAFRAVLESIGAKYPRSEMVRSYEQGLAVPKELGFPIILRPNFTLGGGGGGVAYSQEEYENMLAQALKESPTSEVLIEESILGWKEFELEVMRDKAGTFVVICSIENLDPCGVHTGDSITVAPQQTLTDRQYQEMRDEARKIVDAVGLEVGGANVQFAVHPTTGERYVIEMNPRVSRSSALASKATGFPIAKISALLAVGYTLDEIQNDITGTTPSCYEPALDYVVTKIPKFSFEKFARSEDLLTTQMRSVGEVMALGRTFKESLGKALSALEGSAGFDPVIFKESDLAYPNSRRIYHVAQAFREGYTVSEIESLTHINAWFLEQIRQMVGVEATIARDGLNAATIFEAKRCGISDQRIAQILEKTEAEIREFRIQQKIRPGYLRVDTCAGEFDSQTPYFYSSYWSQRDTRPVEPNKVVILGSGPNRIGQGIEFDYCCVRGVKAFQRSGYKVVMINSNPETVSTDYDTSDELYFEPLTDEFVLEVMDYLQPKGFVAQLGGQTPIQIAPALVEAGYSILGSSLDSIDLAEDRGQFTKICKQLEFRIPKATTAANLEEALRAATEVGFPIICRPSYVLGGRRMQVIETEEELIDYFQRNDGQFSVKRPCLIDQFLEGALEVDVDLVRGPGWTIIGGIVEHIEAAGVHSGDSMGVLPPQRLKEATCEKIEALSRALADRMEVIGHLNLQLAVKDDEIYMLEANPRSSRSVPFVSKATRIPVVDLAVYAMLGQELNSETVRKYSNWSGLDKVSVKGVVFPFKKFRNADSILGPEMKSTGESMGVGLDYPEALVKALLASHIQLPREGEVFLSLRDKDKDPLLPLARKLVGMGYTLSATKNTAAFLTEQGLDCLTIKKVHEGRPHCVDRIRSGEVAIVINTTSGKLSIEASFSIRRSCIDYSVPCVTESQAAEALVMALERQRSSEIRVSVLNKLL